MKYTAFRPLANTTLMIILILAFMGTALQPSLVLAQATTAITPTTGVDGLRTTVTTNGHTIQITGGTRPGNETNLFHSFDQFSIGPGDAAHFLNTTPFLPTDNILSRVTGGSPSSIFGAIDTMSYPRANLFLMNPAGIVFGPNATLNVAGSVAFTTANYLRLADANGSNAGIFHADTTATDLLTSASVAAFGFLGPNPPVAIAVQGSTLAVQPGRSMSFVGGNHGFTPKTGNAVLVPGGVAVTDGHLSAPSGQINVVGVASPGEILAGTFESAANVNLQSSDASGMVRISKSSIDGRGNGGGTILVRGGRLLVDASMIKSDTGSITLDGRSIQISNASVIETSTAPSSDSGHIHLLASGDVEIESSHIDTFTSTDSSGQAGNITVSSSQGNVYLSGGAFISSSTDSESIGNTGDIVVEASHGNISLVDDSFITNAANGAGTLGEIRINAHNLSLESRSSIAGDNSSIGTDKPGDVQITLDGRLSLTGGSFISTTAFASLDSGDLLIRAPEIFITGKDSTGGGSALFNNTTSSGNGGSLRLFTDNLQLTNGGVLFTKSNIPNSQIPPSGHGGAVNLKGYRNPGTSVVIDGPGSGIFSNAEGIGAAGDISVKATSLTLQNGGKISAETTGTSSTATGGSITINATDQVTLKNGASITASSTGPADAGSIFINAGQQLEVLDDSSITTQAARASGGNIDIRAIDRIRFVNSTVSTSVLAEDGKGGNIFIDPNVVILEGSEVAAKAVGGAGGNITFVTPLFLADSVSLGLLSAKSESGLNGTVLIQSPTSNLSGAVGQLVSKTSPPQVLLQNRCIALAGGEQSTFLLAGRDALPAEPGGWLSSPVAMEHWTGEETEEHVSRLMVQNRGWNRQPPLVMSKDETTVLSLRRLTPPGFLIRTFATDTTGCPA